MKEKSDNIVTTPSKLQSFEEVQKALQDLTKKINDLSASTNSAAEGEITDKDGKTGDIRVTQNKDKTYGLELKTDEGWKFPSVGGSPVQLSGKKGEKAKPDAIVDKHKDDLGNAVALPRPDYDSGWVAVLDNATTGTHTLGTIARLGIWHWSLDDGVNVYMDLSEDGGRHSHLKLTTTTWEIRGSTYYGHYFDGASHQLVDTNGKFRVYLWK